MKIEENNGTKVDTIQSIIILRSSTAQNLTKKDFSETWNLP